jgi:hypothetical protein
MVSKPRFTPEPTSAPGDFYVEYGCCATCGIPQSIAPDLVGWTDHTPGLHCRWIKQPSTPEELIRAFAIFSEREMCCHRYAGTDPAIQARVGIQNCDHPVIVEPQEIPRDRDLARLSIFNPETTRELR